MYSLGFSGAFPKEAINDPAHHVVREVRGGSSVSWSHTLTVTRGSAKSYHYRGS